MKQLKIRWDFFEQIKKGFKNFEIRKDKYLEGEVELIVFERKFKTKCEGYQTKTMRDSMTDNQCFYNGNCCDYCIQDKLKVKLTLDKEMNAFKIGQNLQKRIDYAESNNNLLLMSMYIKILDFLNEYFKQGDELYWYDLEVLE
ncbi:DUF3850 domain-containing protein [Spiroplasma endosymbiont of Labia minor]|uniref:DUF3850 domain-containing protein n=1 Tax=Spiroplasma endosymbiont of Labia minor TaxID=3066305 RepID=UPI0030CD3013